MRSGGPTTARTIDQFAPASRSHTRALGGPSWALPSARRLPDAPPLGFRRRPPLEPGLERRHALRRAGSLAGNELETEPEATPLPQGSLPVDAALGADPGVWLGAVEGRELRAPFPPQLVEQRPGAAGAALRGTGLRAHRQPALAPLPSLAIDLEQVHAADLARPGGHAVSVPRQTDVGE